MESTVSVSKGVFIFPNGFKKSKHSKKNASSFFERIYKRDLWYATYKTNWGLIETQINELHQRAYSVLMNDVVSHVKQAYDCDEAFTMEGVIPSATLLTGVSQPDHVGQFRALIEMIKEQVTPHVALVNSQDASTVKNLVENSVWQLMNEQYHLDMSHEDDVKTKSKLKKNQCTMKSLNKWYKVEYEATMKKKNDKVYRRSLVVIIPDFESFSCSVLQDFVMIISSYVPTLPIVLVFGVATSVSVLHKSFPYHVSSKLLIKVFHSHSSPVYMNQVLEDIFLTHASPFHLSGKAFELLTDVFLFYDFSVTGLIHSIKYCMMEHYYGDNIKSLCCDRYKLDEAIMKLNAEDLELIRQLLSFRPFLEQQDCRTKIQLFENDDFFREVLFKELNALHDYLYSFYLCVRLLASFVKDLPKSNLGKTVREIYTKCALENIVNAPSFIECMQLIKFQSQTKLVENIKNAVKIVNSYLQITSPVKPLRSTPTKNNINSTFLSKDLGENFAKTIRVHLLTFLRQIEHANTEASTSIANEDCDDTENTPGNRYKLKEKLLKATRADRIQSEFEMVRSRFVSYLKEMFERGLQPPQSQTFHEILFFSDVTSVKKQIVGSPRGALHTALSNPTHYLQCSCCILPSSESVVDTLPDVCLAYKLHRECGKHINLYDWLQAFAAVLQPDIEDEERHEDASIQVRFTRAVAELQFLGFIKSSKRKTDHVMRLTW